MDEAYKSKYSVYPGADKMYYDLRDRYWWHGMKKDIAEHVINGNEIHADPSKIEDVKNWKAPRTLTEVRSFLGLARYYRRFIENYSRIAKSLTILTQKCKTFDWGEEQELAFQTLKDNLCNAPILALPDGPEDFVVYCDTSEIGLGCVLMQKGKVIAYETKSVIYKDNKILQHIFSQKELNMRQRRWIELFSDYDCEIRYHPGKENVVADALSRKERVKPNRVRAMKMILQTSSGHDTIWVIVDRLTKSTYFLPKREDYKMDKLARLYWNEKVARHGVPISIISNRDSHFTSRKERVKPNRVRAMKMILQSSIKDKILAAQKEAVDEFVGL
nr:putative reverse transcriptase domain-containing protein [Tanacetum cinerariifolium]